MATSHSLNTNGPSPGMADIGWVSRWGSNAILTAHPATTPRTAPATTDNVTTRQVEARSPP